MTRPDAVVHDLLAGNAKHQAAQAAKAEEVQVLRHDIGETLTMLVGLADQLEALAGNRQRLRARLVTEETREIFEKQTKLDRAAARGLVDQVTDPGLRWLNTAARIGTGQVQAPVQTMPALSVVAEIRYTLRHNIARLGRPAKLVALEAEQIADETAEERGFCPWPRRERNPILTATLDEADSGVGHLAARLMLLVDGYTNRKDLKAIARDLDRLEEAALDITEGMAGRSALPIGSETCPHCGRDTLALLSRVPGQHALVVRCEGEHRCECTWEFCDCHRNPRRNRHEWVNSGSAAHTFHELHNLQTKRKELTILETKALDAIDVIRQLHQAIATYPDADTCTDPTHVEHHTEAMWSNDEICTACPPIRHVCGTCTDADPEQGALYLTWPCPTARACDLESTTDNDPDDPSTTDTTK